MSRSGSVVTVGELWIYLGFFVTLVAAGLGFPAPEEIVISGAGVLAGQAPDHPPELDIPIAQPTPAEVAGLLALSPDAGCPAALPWAALVRTGAPYKFCEADVTALLAVAPQAGFPGALPWPALSRAAPPTIHRDPPPITSIPVRWWILLPVCVLGVVLSDILLYFGGRFFGDRLLEHRWLARVVPRERRRRTEENFHRYGVSILVFGRLVPGIRSPLFLTAGTMRLPLPRFMLADALGAVVGNSLFFFLGFWLGNQFESLVGKAEERLKPILIVTGIGLLAAYLVWHFLRHPVSTGDPKEVPLIGQQVASHIKCPDPPCPEKEVSADGEGKKVSANAAQEKEPATEDSAPHA
jgi:membrane protein DedA with SNARE-associated domain